MIKTICAFSAGFILAALVDFNVSPSYNDKDSILREPFALVPFGAASTAVAVGTGAFVLISRALPSEPRI